MISPPGPECPVYTPSEINREVKVHIEAGFGRIWLQGEISNLAQPSSGHRYFSLKDAKSQIRCAFFKGQASQLQHPPSNGDQVLIRGQLSLYEARGDYQFIVEAMLGAGQGALHAAFEQLKAQLQAEGLFEVGLKKTLPDWPNRIGVVTSPSGAALRDIRHTLAKRWPVADVTLFPTLVQGEEAPAGIVQALEQANQTAGVDVLIVARGGGSIEDLWAFNTEPVARQIAQMTMPVVTGIGHETDTTIADFIADVRAATPTGAAVLVTPNIQELQSQLSTYLNRLTGALIRKLDQRAQTIDGLERRLGQCHPAHWLDQATTELLRLRRGLEQQIQAHLILRSQQLAALSRTLHGLSPLGVLSRGYGIIKGPNGQGITEDNPPTKGMLLNILTDLFDVTSEVRSVTKRRGPKTH